MSSPIPAAAHKKRTVPSIPIPAKEQKVLGPWSYSPSYDEIGDKYKKAGCMQS